MSRFIQTVAVLALAVVKRVVAVQTKHAQRLFGMQLNGLEYGPVPLLTLNQVAARDCHIPYSIGIDDLHHDDCVRQIVNRVHAEPAFHDDVWNAFQHEN